MGGSYYNVFFSFLLRVRVSIERRGHKERKYAEKYKLQLATSKFIVALLLFFPYLWSGLLEA